MLFSTSSLSLDGAFFTTTCADQHYNDVDIDIHFGHMMFFFEIVTFVQAFALALPISQFDIG